MGTESLAGVSVAEFLDRLASAAPTPGGGSVAALTGAQAAALGQMVVGFTLGREKFAAVEPRVREIADRLARAGQLLRRLIDEDAAAYEVLSDALQLGKSDPQRRSRVQQAAVLAGSVPLETAALCSSVLADVAELREIGNPLLKSDAEAATHLARAALQAAAANVRANLPLMSPENAKEIAGQLDGLVALVD